MKLSDKAQQCQLLREEIDKLVSTELYTIEDVLALSDQLSVLLNESIQSGDNTEQYATFLQLNLDWLQVLMAKLSKDKDAIAINVLNLKKGIRARESYGQTN